MIKRLLFKMLCNSVTGSAVTTIFGDRIPDLRWPGYRFIVNRTSVTKRHIASIFWGFYESAEIRLIEGHLTQHTDVVELGGSIGVVSSHIASKLGEGRTLVTVEANPRLIDAIRTNAGRHLKKNANFFAENCAICYSADSVDLRITDNNTETRVLNEGSEGKGTLTVKACSLAAVVERYGFDNFALVCDIEGSEIEIFMNESVCLKKCKQLFVELHATSYKGGSYSVADLVTIIRERHSFTEVEHHGPVYYFKRD